MAPAGAHTVNADTAIKLAIRALSGYHPNQRDQIHAMRKAHRILEEALVHSPVLQNDWKDPAIHHYDRRHDEERTFPMKHHSGVPFRTYTQSTNKEQPTC